MTDLTKMRERLAFLDAEIARARPAATAYNRYMRGKAAHPGQQVAGDAGYYSRRITERTQLRKGIAAAEQTAAMDVKLNDAWPTQAEVAAELAALNAKLEAEANVPHWQRRIRGLTEYAALAMGHLNAMPDDADPTDRAKKVKFIDFCLAEITDIKANNHDHMEAKP